MAEAKCSCGDIALTLPETAGLVVACHCIDCQRRSGSPFGVGVFHRADAVTFSGSPKEYSRPGDSGNQVHNYFCPNCGSTVYWKADRLPGLVGVAVGAIADPTHAAPSRSLYEQSKHHWVEIGGAEGFVQGAASKRLT